MNWCVDISSTVYFLRLFIFVQEYLCFYMHIFILLFFYICISTIWMLMRILVNSWILVFISKILILSFIEFERCFSSSISWNDFFSSAHNFVCRDLSFSYIDLTQKCFFFLSPMSGTAFLIWLSAHLLIYRKATDFSILVFFCYFCLLRMLG